MIEIAETELFPSWLDSLRDADKATQQADIRAAERLAKKA